MGRDIRPPVTPSVREMQQAHRKEEHGAPEARQAEVYAAQEPFTEAYDRYAPLLRKVAVKKFRIPPADVDALVHDVFATYFSNSREVNALEPYLIGAICNAARHYWRRTEATNALFCNEVEWAATPADAIVEEVARKRLLSKILARVGKRCRDIMFRYYVNGETTSAIAEALHLKPTTVLIFLSRCRKHALAAYRNLMERVA
jgi:RNA polymerase sigma factor (sigma-70 family)